MRPIAHMSHVAWSVCVCVCLCVLVTRMCYAQTVEPIEMPFGLGLTLVDPWNHLFYGVEISRRKGAIFGVVRPIEKHWKFLLWCTVCSERDPSITACSERNQSVHNNGMTAELLQPTAMLQTGRCCPP